MTWDDDEWIEVFRARGVWDLTRADAEGWLRANEQFFATVSRHVDDGGRVLELGCGPGRHAIALALQGFRAIGIDRNPVIVSPAQGNARACGVDDRTTFLVGEMDALDSFPGQDVAAITHGGVMEHFESADAIRASLSSQLTLTVAPLWCSTCRTAARRTSGSCWRRSTYGSGTSSATTPASMTDDLVVAVSA